ncbi:hypothetical protein MMC26_003100 [Xylographa opegraphella]|nr:hypothetical protein [Xylographa opegraphella]
MSHDPLLARIAAVKKNSSVRPAYLDYRPKPFPGTDSSSHRDRTHLDKLKFEILDDPLAVEPRLQFGRDLGVHVSVPKILRSTRSKRSLDLAQSLHGRRRGTVTGSPQATTKKQKPPATSAKEPLINSPLDTRNTSVTRLSVTNPSSTAANNAYLGYSVSHGTKRQDTPEAINNFRKRARLDPNLTATSTPQIAPPVTQWNNIARNARRASDGAPGFFIPSMTGNGRPRPNGRLATTGSVHHDDTIITIDDNSDSAEVTDHLSQITGPNAPSSTKFEAKVTIKAQRLSSEIMSKTTLLVTATNLHDMAPVTVKLSCFKGFRSFLDFLADECVLGDLSKKVTDVSATYTWNGRKHRFRKERLDVDWLAFCKVLRDAFQTNPTLTKQGSEVEMLLHVAV